MKETLKKIMAFCWLPERYNLPGRRCNTLLTAEMCHTELDLLLP